MSHGMRTHMIRFARSPLPLSSAHSISNPIRLFATRNATAGTFSTAVGLKSSSSVSVSGSAVSNPIAASFAPRAMALFAPGPDNLFAKMVRGEIPCNKVAESEHWLAFLDINPLAKGHTLIIPKVNVQRAHEVPAEHMATFGPFLTKVIKTVVPAGMGYNLLQNNGSEAHQFVMYVHFHIIPKPDEDSGLKMSWTPKPPTAEELAADAAAYRKAFEELP